MLLATKAINIVYVFLESDIVHLIDRQIDCGFSFLWTKTLKKFDNYLANFRDQVF